MPKPFLVLVGLQVANLFAVLALYYSGHESAATFCSLIVTQLILYSFLAYAVFDSRTRWPGLRWHDRFAKILTLSR